MSDWELREGVDPIRACPFRCGWEAKRRIKPGCFTSVRSLLPVFIKRCHDDIAEHLQKDHGAKPFTSPENYLASPEGQAALREAVAELDELKARILAA